MSPDPPSWTLSGAETTSSSFDHPIRDLAVVTAAIPDHLLEAILAHLQGSGRRSQLSVAGVSWAWRRVALGRFFASPWDSASFLCHPSQLFELSPRAPRGSRSGLLKCHVRRERGEGRARVFTLWLGKDPAASASGGAGPRTHFLARATQPSPRSDVSIHLGRRGLGEPVAWLRNNAFATSYRLFLASPPARGGGGSGEAAGTAADVGHSAGSPQPMSRAPSPPPLAWDAKGDGSTHPLVRGPSATLAAPAIPGLAGGSPSPPTPPSPARGSALARARRALSRIGLGGSGSGGDAGGTPRSPPSPAADLSRSPSLVAGRDPSRADEGSLARDPSTPSLLAHEARYRGSSAASAPPPFVAAELAYKARVKGFMQPRKLHVILPEIGEAHSPIPRPLLRAEPTGVWATGPGAPSTRAAAAAAAASPRTPGAEPSPWRLGSPGGASPPDSRLDSATFDDLAAGVPAKADGVRQGSPGWGGAGTSGDRRGTAESEGDGTEPCEDEGCAARGGGRYGGPSPPGEREDQPGREGVGGGGGALAATPAAPASGRDTRPSAPPPPRPPSPATELPSGSGRLARALLRATSSQAPGAAPAGAPPTPPARPARELSNKPPHWNAVLRCWCLNFRGRVRLASVKNFQLVERGDASQRVVMQFGRADEDTFILDFDPRIMSAAQAFAIGLSTFDSKVML